MAGMIYEFIEALNIENELYANLIKLAENKKSHIIRGDIEKINELTNKEEDVVLKLKGCERKRSQLMADIALILNQNPKTITITQILEALKNQPSEAEELNKIKTILSESLGALRKINDENIVLINQSLEYAEFSMNVMQSKMGAQPLNANYGGGDEKPGKSFFDTKQ